MTNHERTDLLARIANLERELAACQQQRDNLRAAHNSAQNAGNGLAATATSILAELEIVTKQRDEQIAETKRAWENYEFFRKKVDEWKVEYKLVAEQRDQLAVALREIYAHAWAMGRSATAALETAQGEAHDSGASASGENENRG